MTKLEKDLTETIELYKDQIEIYKQQIELYEQKEKLLKSKGSSSVLVELAPQGGFRPVKLARDWLETIYDQSVGFKSGPRHGWLHKNSRRTNLKVMNMKMDTKY